MLVQLRRDGLVIPDLALRYIDAPTRVTLDVSVWN